MVAKKLLETSGQNAAALTVAEQYVKAFSNLAKTNNTLIMANDASDVAKMTAQVILDRSKLTLTYTFHFKGFDCFPFA